MEESLGQTSGFLEGEGGRQLDVLACTLFLQAALSEKGHFINCTVLILVNIAAERSSPQPGLLRKALERKRGLSLHPSGV